MDNTAVLDGLFFKFNLVKTGIIQYVQRIVKVSLSNGADINSNILKNSKLTLKIRVSCNSASTTLTLPQMPSSVTEVVLKHPNYTFDLGQITQTNIACDFNVIIGIPTAMTHFAFKYVNDPVVITQSGNTNSPFVHATMPSIGTSA